MTVADTATSSRQTVGKPRVFYLDLIRALAALLIVLAHFNHHLDERGGGYVLTREPFGISVGALGVSLFLIISGAALTLTYRRPIDLKKFYRKRFLNIYPMFWTAWVLATLYLTLISERAAPNVGPARTFIFTLLGIDGLALNFHFRTMYLLGEWFIGFIILYYVVFPLILWAIDRFPVVTGVVILAAYAATAVIMHRYFSGYPSSMVLTTRLPELAFGSYFVLYVRRVHWVTVIPAAAVLAVSAMLPEKIPEDVGTTIVGISAFLHPRGRRSLRGNPAGSGLRRPDRQVLLPDLPRPPRGDLAPESADRRLRALPPSALHVAGGRVRPHLRPVGGAGESHRRRRRLRHQGFHGHELAPRGVRG